MKRITILICLLLALTLPILAEVTYDNLKMFFDATYDQNKDGFATPEEFVEFFRIMEPEHDVNMEDIEPIFKFFDSDINRKVTLKEIIDLARIKVTLKNGHKQIHLGLTNQDGEMQVMWVSTPEFYNKPVVYYGRIPGMLKEKEYATMTTYNVGKIGFHGRIYKAVMKGL
jgi:hypothetical protein